MAKQPTLRQILKAEGFKLHSRLPGTDYVSEYTAHQLRELHEKMVKKEIRGYVVLTSNSSDNSGMCDVYIKPRKPTAS